MAANDVRQPRFSYEGLSLQGPKINPQWKYAEYSTSSHQVVSQNFFVEFLLTMRFPVHVRNAELAKGHIYYVFSPKQTSVVQVVIATRIWWSSLFITPEVGEALPPQSACPTYSFVVAVSLLQLKGCCGVVETSTRSRVCCCH